ncbi:transcription factor jumonji [Streptomyces sp. NPDC017949]|uniref:transcription factor jumonji n=1 Tax=Streptomyces sp. NPDC017949 TaxID=3365020 RepID=UPI00379C2E2B
MTTSTREMSDAAGLTEQLCGDKPVVLRGAGLDWPVYAALQEERLRDLDRPVVAEGPERQPTTVQLSEILDELHAELPLGLYLRNQLVSEFEPALWDLVPREIRRLNWLLALPAEIRPDWSWLMIGGTGTSSPMHVDTMASGAWNLLCAGRKRWTFHSPERAEEWCLLPPGCCTTGTSDGEFIELLQEPGDVVVTPSGWAHEVHNLTGTISITANFINRSNLGFAKRYFEVLGDRASHEVLTAVGATFELLDSNDDSGEANTAGSGGGTGDRRRTSDESRGR